MAENKMAEVAAMFGKKLNEDFYIKRCKTLTFRFTREGLKLWKPDVHCWLPADEVLLDLLKGRMAVQDTD